MQLDQFIGGYNRLDLRAATRRGHVASLRLLASIVEGGRPLHKIQRGEVLRAIEGGRVAGLRPSTVAKHARYLHAAFAYAVRMGYCTENPATDLGVRQHFSPVEWEYVSDEGVSEVMAKVDGRVAVAVALCRYAGMRINEALRAKWIDVSMQNRTIVIHPTLDDWGRLEEGTKGKRRTVPLDPRITHVLQQHTHEEYLCGSLRFSDHRGQLARVATWKGQPWHTLRKSCGMDWADKVPINVVAEWLGNSVVVASKHYLKPHAQHFAAISGSLS